MTDQKPMPDFHVAEYNSLRSEIDWLRQSMDRLLLYVSIANAAIASWISSFLFDDQSQNSTIFAIVCWIPILVLALTFLVYARRRREVLSLREYLRELENRYASEDLGWINYQDRMKKKNLQSRHIFYLAYFIQVAFYAGYGIYVTSLAFGGNL